jgi:hypothetical protein
MPRVGELARHASALAEPHRLRVFARLVLAGASGLTGPELAQAEPGAAKAVARLEQAGLVATGEDGRTRVRPEAFTEALRPEREEAGPGQALAHLFADGRLVRMPVRPALRRALLEHLTDRMFQPGVSYSEAEVNIAIRQYWDDPSALRRYLVDGGHLTRSPDGRSYRVAPAPVATA